MQLYLLTGPKHNGKTTRLQHWCRHQTGVGGLLQPVLYKKRYLQDIFSSEKVLLEAPLEEAEVQQIGRFYFSDRAFSWANQALLQAYQNPTLTWLVLDEIGPLELRQQGLHPALQTILHNPLPSKKVVLVIREELVENVLTFYNLRRFPLHTLPV